MRLVEMMGNDQAVVDTARVSFGGTSKGPVADKKLLFYLMEHQHSTPFEHIVFRFHVKCPIFVARQWMRHRMASYSEVSARYTETPDEFYIPTEWRVPDTENKQGSIKSDKLENELLSREMKLICDESYNFYKRFLAKGVSREMARMVLPVNMYTQFYWAVNARSLMNFIKLRADTHAQLEIQKYAEAHATIFKEKCPWTYEAFTKFSRKGAHNAVEESTLESM